MNVFKTKVDYPESLRVDTDDADLLYEMAETGTNCEVYDVPIRTAETFLERFSDDDTKEFVLELIEEAKKKKKDFITLSFFS